MQPLVVTFAGGKKVVAKYRGFEIATDQPIAAGGDNSAPAPLELFLASLATCAGFYVLSFCQARGIATDDVRLVQTWDTDEETHMINRLKIDIQLPAKFPEKYRAAVVRAADLCAVKKHLHKPPQIEVVATAPVDN